MKARLIKLIIWLAVFTAIGFYFGRRSVETEVIYEINLAVPASPECVDQNVIDEYFREDYKNERLQNVEPSSDPKPKPALIHGKASYYNREICKLHGTTYGDNCLTANGELFNDEKITAACPAHLLNKKITVSSGDKSIEVLCNDTGAFTEKYGRVLDLSEAAFALLAPTSEGVIKVAYSVN